MHASSAPIRAVLFDFGNTLFDTADSIDFIVRHAASLGSPLAADEARALWTAARVRSRTVEEFAKGRDLGEARHRSCWLDLWAELEARSPGVSEPLYRYETGGDGWTPYVDTRVTLDALRERGVPMAIVSDVGWDLLPVFEQHDLAGYFSAFVMSYRVGVTKPAALMFDTACERLGVEPGAALMVGDNFRNDGGAVDAGLRTLLLPMVPSGSPRGLDAVVALVDAAR